MDFRIDPGDERAIYVQIVDEIRRFVVLGTLRPGDALPSVRQLAAHVRVNPNTVKQAYRELEREGLAHAEPGRGTFVSHTPRVRPGQERAALARGVADRAVRDAYRHGLTPDELIAAIREATDAAGEGEGAA